MNRQCRDCPTRGASSLRRRPFARRAQRRARIPDIDRSSHPAARRPATPGSELSATGQSSWPPPGTVVAATGQMLGSALAMFRKRRRPGTLGLPRRPADVTLSRKVAAVGIASGIAFPQWGVTALAVLAVDRWIIRRIPRLRAAFGQR